MLLTTFMGAKIRVAVSLAAKGKGELNDLAQMGTGTGTVVLDEDQVGNWPIR